MSVRSLLTTFDMFSPQSKTYSCRIKKEKFEFDPIPELIVEREETKLTVAESEVEEENIPPELKALMNDSEIESKKVT